MGDQNYHKSEKSDTPEDIWPSKPHQLYNHIMEFNREKVGAAGWLGLAAYVIAWDAIAPETLTSAYKRAHVAVRVGALAVTGAHLMGAIPRRFDPFYWPVDLGLMPVGTDKGPTIDDTMEL